jgi:putative spermidine/putrescine transport system permease protein
MEYYQHVFLRNDQTLPAIVTSILLGFVTTIFTLIIAIPAGKALVHYNFFGKKFIKVLVLVPLIVPGIAVSIGNQISMIRLGLAGTFVGVALIHCVFALPFAIRIMGNVFEAAGTNLQLQGVVLGGSPLFIFRHITLPQIMPGIVAAGALSFTVSISQYITTFMIGGGRIITVTMLLIPHIQSGQTHIAAVYSVLLIVTAMICMILIERIIRRYYKFENVLYI